MTTSSSIILGGGVNGLTAAYYLARAGVKPILLERERLVGGGAITRQLHPGFQVPAYSHELLLNARIVADMALHRHGLQMLDGGVDVCAPSLDGPPLIIYADAARTAAALAPLSAPDAQRWQSFQDDMNAVADVIAPLLTAAPPRLNRPGARDIWELLKAGRRFRTLGRRTAQSLLRWGPMPLYDFTHEWFANDRLRALIAARGLSGTMLAPRSAGGTLVLLLRQAHTRMAGGRSFSVKGGPGACAAAMAAAARHAGAEIRTGVTVERLVTRGGRVTGVIANGEELPASTVISALDPKTTLLSLVDAGELPADVLERMRHFRSSGSMAKVNLALSTLPAFAGVAAGAGGAGHPLSGRIHIGERLDDLERAFDPVKYGDVAAAPWLDVAIPSLRDPSLAPAGSHVASIYVHSVPRRLRDGDAAAMRDVVLRRTLERLERYAPGIGKLVVAAEAITPEDLERSPGMWGGHPFHGELAPDQLFGLRPPTGSAAYRTPIEGLFLGGAGTHPGGFVTGVSGRLAAADALQSTRR